MSSVTPIAVIIVSFANKRAMGQCLLPLHSTLGWGYLGTDNTDKVWFITTINQTHSS